MYLITATIKKTPDVYVLSKSKNVKKRVERLKYNIESINGRKNGRLHKRFEPFVGCTLDDVSIDVYKHVLTA